MLPHTKFVCILSVIFILSSLPGCTSTSVVPPTQMEPTAEIVSPTPEPATPTPVQATLVPATSTPEETATDFPTSLDLPSPTPTIPMVMPEFYPVNRCKNKRAEYFNVEFCIVSIHVKLNRHMVVNVSWMVNSVYPGLSQVYKVTDENNKLIYLTDNLNNRYDFVNGGGAAFTKTQVIFGEPLYGWFEFEAPPPGALNFSYHDDYSKIYIGHISLDVAAAPYLSLPLRSSDYVLKYLQEEWNKTKDENGNDQLESVKIPGCSIRSIDYEKAQGNLKNTVKLAGIDYEIWGFYDAESNLNIREYVAFGGLEGLSRKNQLLFWVTLPPDKATECGTSVGNTLEHLELAKTE
jgi:hypothetical protein